MTWQDDAACTGHPTHWWFPADDGRTTAQLRKDTAAALAICDTCPVATDCATAGRNEPQGIWGGRSPGAEHYTQIVRTRTSRHFPTVETRLAARDNRLAARVLKINPMRIGR